MLTVVIVLAVMFALALYGYLNDGWGSQPYALSAETSHPAFLGQRCYDEKTRDDIRKLSLQALDLALIDHIQTLYGVWMKDINDSSQPGRAQNGTQNGIKAYAHGRKLMQDWDPVICQPN